jgi:hypothetical protein
MECAGAPDVLDGIICTVREKVHDCFNVALRCGDAKRSSTVIVDNIHLSTDYRKVGDL